MPELPEVETVVRSLLPLVGRRIVIAEFRAARILRGADPERMAARLAGRRIDSIRRYGKFILMSLSGGGYLLMHLGMTGRLLLDAAPGKHTHAIFTLDGGVLQFDDSRQFGAIAAGADFRARRGQHLRRRGALPGRHSSPGAHRAAAAGPRAWAAPGSRRSAHRGHRRRRLLDFRLRGFGRPARPFPGQPPRVPAHRRAVRELRRPHPAAAGGPAQFALLPALSEAVAAGSEFKPCPTQSPLLVTGRRGAASLVMQLVCYLSYDLGSTVLPRLSAPILGRARTLRR